MTIKEMRDSTGLTQKAFAEIFGIPIGTLRRWEYGESTPAPYIIRLMEGILPLDTEKLQKIESSKSTYYYDEIAKCIIDKRGIRIKVNENIAGVKPQNLAIYVDDLFEAYYDAVNKFDTDCKIDKKEDILWG